MQIYACPIYETMDTAWGRKHEGTWSFFNITERFVTRVLYMVLTTFVAALLPFFGDFIALTGSLSALPLDFVLVLAMTLKVRLGSACCACCGHAFLTQPLYPLLACCSPTISASICVPVVEQR